MAIVYQARHVDLGRLVALKMLRIGQRHDASSRSRLQEEARTLARLRHPNIVKVYDIGDHEGQPFFSLELVGGTNLSRWMNGLPQDSRLAAQIVMRVAIAIDYAHRNGVLHRDLTPGNVLIGDAPEMEAQESGFNLAPEYLTFAPLIKVSDFGLAKVLDELGTRVTPQTEPGLVVGTPQYMAPEQARLNGEAIGPATDVYALGAILYELLTGRPPFPTEAPLKTLYRVVHDEPSPPSRHLPRLSKDLTTICTKCMEKDPARRYTTAAAVAEDLRRYLAHEPILARPIGPVGRLIRWVRRKPSFATLLATTVAVTITAFVVILWLWWDASTARGQAETLASLEALANLAASRQRDNATKARAESDRLAAELLLDESLSTCARGDMDQGLSGLVNTLRSAEAAGLNDLRSVCLANLACWDQQRITVSATPPLSSSVTSVAYSPDGRRILFGQWANRGLKPGGGVARFWDSETWQPTGPELEHASSVISVAYSKNGHVATGSIDGTVQLWDATTGKPLCPPLSELKLVTTVAFSPDGALVAASGNSRASDHEGEVRLWNVSTGRATGPVLKLAGIVDTMTFAPDGQAIVTGSRIPASATASGSSEVRQWDVVTGQPIGPSLIHTSMVRTVSCHPEGTLLLTGGDDRVALLWDRKTGKRVGQPLLHPYTIRSSTFAQDGKSVLTGGGDLLSGASTGAGQTPYANEVAGARLWDIKGGTLLLPPILNWEIVSGVAIHPDGQSLALACRSGHIRRFRFGSRRPEGEQKYPFLLSDLKFSPDGTRLLVAGGDPAKSTGQSQIWNAETIRPTSSPVEYSSAFTTCAFTADGSGYAIGDYHGVVRVFDSLTNQSISLPLKHPGGLDSLTFSPDGRLLLAFADSSIARLWNWRTGEVVWDNPQASTTKLVRFSADGKTLLTGGATGVARLWDLATGRLIRELPTRKERLILGTFNAANRLVLLGDTTQVARCWDVTTGAPYSPELKHDFDVVWDGGFLNHAMNVYTVAGSGYGKNGYVCLWDAKAGRLWKQLPFSVNVKRVVIDHDRRMLVTGGWAGGVRLWDSLTGRQIGPELLHVGNVRAIACAPSGRRVATMAEDGTLRIWQIPAPRNGTHDEIVRWLNARAEEGR